MNPTTPSVYDDPRLTSARSAYESADRQATQTEASAVSLPTMLKDALNKKFSADNPLVQGRERALQNYLTVNDQAPLDVTAKSAGGRSDVVYTPLEQSALIGAKRAAATAGLSTANYLLGTAEGGIADIIDSASRAATAEATRSRGKATAARQSYLDVVDELSRRAEEAFKEREFAEGVRQFNVSQANRGGGTLSERQEAQATQALARDIQRGVTFKELYTRYGADLPEYVIREAYNAGPVAKKYGAAKETSAELISGLSNVKKGKLNDQEGIDAYNSFKTNISDLKSSFSKLNTGDKVAATIPYFGGKFNPNVAGYETLKNQLAYDLRRLNEKGVLSNQEIGRAHV